MIIKNILKTRLNEIQIGLFAEEYVTRRQPELILGDDFNCKLPDLYDEDHVLGFEIVQCEYRSNFFVGKDSRIAQENNYDYTKTVEALRNINVHTDLLSFDCDNNNKITGVTVSQAFQENSLISYNLKNKLNLLNKGHYDACNNIFLLISSILSCKDKFDVSEFHDLYIKLQNDFCRKFDSVYLFTSDGIYEISKKISLIKTLSSDEFNNIIRQAKKNKKLRQAKKLICLKNFFIK